jgi:chromate transporter
MALSMGFKILDQYWKDGMALVLAGAVFLALSVFHARLIPVVLVSGPLAMVWYWPRAGGSCS